MWRGDHQEHQHLDAIVEFPRGPLAVGSDHAIRPTLLRSGAWATLALSATDSCRDRLAGFYHWGDRQALAAAVAIALRHRVNLQTIRRWSEVEGASDQCREFESARMRARARGAKSRRPGRRST